MWRTIKRCVRCCRANPPPVEYLMGDLPEARITESRPFTNVGIDYCGPFYIKERRDRNRRKIKIYAAIFVCLATKAVHIELVSDLTTDAFLAALRRFISRRRHCATILTNNGTNFVGAKNSGPYCSLMTTRKEYRTFSPTDRYNGVSILQTHHTLAVYGKPR